MHWNRYNITTKSGFKYECIMGEWLQPGKYEFGEVEKGARLSDVEVEEHFGAEQFMYDMWYEIVMKEVLE